LINKATQTRDEDGWFVSSFTNGHASCVQVKFAEQGSVLVRDSKDRDAAAPVINMPSTGWTSLLNDISGNSA
jgi:hypothetical protein